MLRYHSPVLGAVLSHQSHHLLIFLANQHNPLGTSKCRISVTVFQLHNFCFFSVSAAALHCDYYLNLLVSTEMIIDNVRTDMLKWGVTADTTFAGMDIYYFMYTRATKKRQLWWKKSGFGDGQIPKEN